jgi:DUF218 domain
LKKVILIVPFDLCRDKLGRIVVGSETKIACDRAIELASQDPDDSIIVTMAGIAGKRWNNIWMAWVIRDYVRSCAPREVRCVVGRADTFNTSGEMKKLADMIATSKLGSDGVTLVVKWWHAPRAKLLCRYWLKKYGLSQVKVTVVSCHSHVGWHTIAAEFLGAWPKNLLRLALAEVGVT